jgi:hypothetical protein
MTALAFTIVGIMLVGGLLLACAIVAAVWFGVSTARPEFLARKPRGDRPPH